MRTNSINQLKTLYTNLSHTERVFFPKALAEALQSPGASDLLIFKLARLHENWFYSGLRRLYQSADYQAWCILESSLLLMGDRAQKNFDEISNYRDCQAELLESLRICSRAKLFSGPYGQQNFDKLLKCRMGEALKNLYRYGLFIPDHAQLYFDAIAIAGNNLRLLKSESNDIDSEFIYLDQSDGKIVYTLCRPNKHKFNQLTDIEAPSDFTLTELNKLKTEILTFIYNQRNIESINCPYKSKFLAHCIKRLAQVGLFSNEKRIGNLHRLTSHTNLRAMYKLLELLYANRLLLGPHAQTNFNVATSHLDPSGLYEDIARTNMFYNYRFLKVPFLSGPTGQICFTALAQYKESYEVSRVVQAIRILQVNGLMHGRKGKENVQQLVTHLSVLFYGECMGVWCIMPFASAPKLNQGKFDMMCHIAQIYKDIPREGGMALEKYLRGEITPDLNMSLHEFQTSFPGECQEEQATQDNLIDEEELVPVAHVTCLSNKIAFFTAAPEVSMAQQTEKQCPVMIRELYMPVFFSAMVLCLIGAHCDNNKVSMAFLGIAVGLISTFEYMVYHEENTAGKQTLCAGFGM